MTVPTVRRVRPATGLLAPQQHVQTATFVSQAQSIYLRILLSLEITSLLVLRLFKLVLVAIVLVPVHNLRIVLVVILFLQEFLQQVTTAKQDALQTKQAIIYHQVLLNPAVHHLVTVLMEHLLQLFSLLQDILPHLQV